MRIIRQLAGLALTAILMPATASPSPQSEIRKACASETSQNQFNCDCAVSKFSEAASGLSSDETRALTYLALNILGDASANAKLASVQPDILLSVMASADPVIDVAIDCRSEDFETQLAEAEEEARQAQADYDAQVKAEEERVAAIQTAPPPPEVKDPANYPALSGQAGAEAATEFRDFMIADCRSFGNSPGYCGCYADETARLMSAERKRAYFVSSKVGLEARNGAIDWDDVDGVVAERLGVEEKQVRDYRAQWNAMVQSQDYQDIHFACEAYK